MLDNLQASERLIELAPLLHIVQSHVKNALESASISPQRIMIAFGLTLSMYWIPLPTDPRIWLPDAATSLNVTAQDFSPVRVSRGLTVTLFLRIYNEKGRAV